MKNRKKILLILLVIILLSFFLIFYNSFLVLETKEIDFQINVEKRMGINIDTDKLYFGTVYRGGIVKRDVFVENYDYPRVRVNIKVYSDVDDWISVDSNHFILKKGESKNVVFNAQVPLDASYESHEGKIKIVFTKF